MKQIALIGCDNYRMHKIPTTFERGRTYVVSDEHAEKLLADETEYGLPYFKLVSDRGADPVQGQIKRGRPKKTAPAQPVTEPVNPVMLDEPDLDEDDDETDTEGAVGMVETA